MKIVYLVFLFLFLYGKANSQLFDNNWPLGYYDNAGGFDSIDNGLMIINFEVGFPPIEKSFPNIRLDGTNAIISDSMGNLECFTNGVNVYNNQYEIIENGEEFQSSDTYEAGYLLPQGAIILPLPEGNREYAFLLGDLAWFDFNGIATAGISPLTYSLIDMNGNNGVGTVCLLYTSPSPRDS